jgi:hypothetical protein
MSRILSSALLIVFFCTSCVKNSTKLSEIGNDDFTILLPANFIQPSDPQEGSVLHLCEDTSDFLNGLSVVVYKDSRVDDGDTTDIYSYYNFVANNILDETLESGNLETPKDTVINGLKSLLFKNCGISGQIDSTGNVCFYSGVYEGRKDFYEVTVWCKETETGKYANHIKQILGSFSEKQLNSKTNN